VPYFDQGEDDADDYQQRTEYFGNIGHTLQIHFEHAKARKIVSLHDRPFHPRNAAFPRSGHSNVGDFANLTGG
jgi:hypothetical protein